MVAGIYVCWALLFLFPCVYAGERITNMSFNRYVDRKFGSPVRMLFVLMGLIVGVVMGLSICRMVGWL
jgi:hypothetical protein